MNILKQLFEIILLRRRPRDLQYDEFAAAFSVVFVTGLTYLVHVQIEEFSSPLAYALIPTVVVVFTVYAILRAAEIHNRFVQTITAIFGTQCIIGILSMGIKSIEEIHVLLPLLVTWNTFIGVLVMKDAIDCKWLRAFFTFIGIQFLSIIVLTLLYPQFLAEYQQLAGIQLPAK